MTDWRLRMDYAEAKGEPIYVTEAERDELRALPPPTPDPATALFPPAVQASMAAFTGVAVVVDEVRGAAHEAAAQLWQSRGSPRPRPVVWPSREDVDASRRGWKGRPRAR